ncbi:FGGY carbohydrate kinase domain-containing protein isoform X2 [Condylostylus longicornis]|uniref:FGGY carbohydrate kinase domain-containing protein isoform X2 n=1 Tax=Condylostylus longicornis TaxID=2530218 RepID=UPI00244DA37E|nr:FGGY carbohydrate kinase domain-containing protein isoform X2 [Condylostylus longicornis]
MPRIYFVGVDVGTGSVRAALVTSQGQVIKQHAKSIKTWNPEANYYEQSSEDIWNAVCECVRNVVQEIEPEEVAGISFDATCSLVVLSDDGKPLTVSKTGQNNQNVILWMDHRASKEAEIINETKHELLNYVGGKVSLEMQMPKLLWLKRNLQLSCWQKIWKVFDLPDFLTWKSTGDDSRSLCSVVCKWNFDATTHSWSKEFLDCINLAELYSNNFYKIGNNIISPGLAVGNGLSEEAARNMNLIPNTTVGASLIDAHAGALGMFGCQINKSINLENKIALICGTSTCHMSLTEFPCWVKGVWGPYKDVIFPNFYLNEGGQSAAGALLDHIVFNHPQYKFIVSKLDENENIYNYLNNVLQKLAEQNGFDDVCYLTKDLHIWPDFHGNRSPIGDSDLKGMISGLIMKTNEENLAILYLAVIQALSYGTRHIIESLVGQDHPKFEALLFCGGLAKNILYVETHASVCDIPSVIPAEQEMVLVGCAMLAASAARVYPSLQETSMAMGGSGKIYEPKKTAIKYHNEKYKIFLKMLEHQLLYKHIMKNAF